VKRKPFNYSMISFEYINAVRSFFNQNIAKKCYHVCSSTLQKIAPYWQVMYFRKSRKLAQLFKMGLTSRTAAVISGTIALNHPSECASGQLYSSLRTNLKVSLDCCELQDTFWYLVGQVKTLNGHHADRGL